ncbi:unnamed protein product, partial [Onchocerca flexuosa]|uniref:ZM domain-containing protein n=1 Tax=Onchocerca flexuosa TaxID=387005 RepID=A0A183I5B6_9BILA
NLSPIYYYFQARIKTGGAPYSEPLSLIPDRSPSAVPSEISGDPATSVSVVPTPSPCSSDSFDLGQILASYGYVPCATFKPGTTVVHITSTVGLTANRSTNHHRLRGGGSGLNNSNFRGSNSRARGGFVYNQRVCTSDHRDFSTNSNYQHGGNRRNNKNHDDAHRDGYRDRNNVPPLAFVRPRGRQNRFNNFYSSRNQRMYMIIIDAVRSRTPVESPKNNQNDNIQQRYDYDQSSGRNVQTKQQRRKQRDTPLPGISSGNNKSVMCPPIICLPPEEGKKSEQQCCSKTASDDDSKLERSNSRKTVDTEYSFEEGAFPCLSEKISPVVEIKESKSRNKPTFSSVAAGKREEKKEAKERKSYAQTLKQNNGLLQAS